MTRTPTRPVIAPERRRQLRQQRRQERLRQLWRITLFSAAAAGLGWGLLREGWVLRNPDQIEVLGSSQVSREQVIREAQLRLPQPLLNLKPQELAQRLAAGLPVEQVQVSRLMLPPRLRISLVEREAVAKAQRRSSKGMERGYVDRLGNWMTSRQKRGSGANRTPQVMVIGWQERLRAPLAEVMAQEDRLGSTLQQVRFEPNGSLWLRTAALGDVHLGLPDERLSRRLDVLRHLSTHLPKQIKTLKIQSIDLSDPEQPELGLPGKGRLSIAALQKATAQANRPKPASGAPTPAAPTPSAD
ncbi:MAG: FtsQ-type POTRA domain-containing protein [Vulcanococcus sp.]|uniref:cell division protein FtsQ/DivIB n=1 Tax=Vulcanococcus sp. TaxID=2856995 RepID=UPI0025E3B99F|nr:FtsQ-type POTRA domain-containing protein [Vulcanococcus sp.]MBW0166355.1 FtsQ-type POTRA domain-containing protein [Vulcanococcus sp.]